MFPRSSGFCRVPPPEEYGYEIDYLLRYLIVNPLKIGGRETVNGPELKP
jgi:hypothetical protein